MGAYMVARTKILSLGTANNRDGPQVMEEGKNHYL